MNITQQAYRADFFLLLLDNRHRSMASAAFNSQMVNVCTEREARHPVQNKSHLAAGPVKV